MKILLIGGGTGGHIMPIVAVAQEIKKLAHQKNEKIELLWIGEKKSYEESAAKKYHIKFTAIFCGKFRRYFSIRNFFDVFKIPIGYLQAKRILKNFKPDAIFSKGGYVSAPVIFAARKLQIPIFLHESDSIPGQANLYFAKYAKKIFIAFPQSADYFEKSNKGKIIAAGMPLRPEIFLGNKKEAFRIFGLDYHKPVILVWGGSQGAKKINETILQILPELLKKYQVIHLSGQRDFNQKPPPAQAGKLGWGTSYFLFKNLDGRQLANAISVADLVVSRAGSNSLFELAALDKPTILIPYLYAAANHQTKNAKIFEKAGAAKIISEDEASFTQKLLNEINEILKNPAQKEKLSANIFKLYKDLSDKAAEKIAGEILKM